MDHKNHRVVSPTCKVSSRPQVQLSLFRRKAIMQLSPMFPFSLSPLFPSPSVAYSPPSPRASTAPALARYTQTARSPAPGKSVLPVLKPSSAVSYCCCHQTASFHAPLYCCCYWHLRYGGPHMPWRPQRWSMRATAKRIPPHGHARGVSRESHHGGRWLRDWS